MTALTGLVPAGARADLATVRPAWNAAFWPLLLLALIAVAVGARATSIASRSSGIIDIENVELARDFTLSARTGQPSAVVGSHDRIPGYALLLMAAAHLDPAVEQGLGCAIADRSRSAPRARLDALHTLRRQRTGGAGSQSPLDRRMQ